MSKVLDESIKIVIKDLLDNHIAILNFTEVFIFQRFHIYEEKIKDLKLEIKDKLEEVDPPPSICE